MTRSKWRATLGIVLLLLLNAGCGGMRPTTFFHHDYDFGYLERVAIVPLENLSGEQGAASRASRILITEILATEAFEVVEPGEVARVLARSGTVRAGELSQEELTTIGKELGVQGIFLGSVDESNTLRSGSSTVNVMTMTLRLVETDTGVTVWSATHTEGGRGFWSTALGTGERSMGQVTRACVQRILDTLVK